MQDVLKERGVSFKNKKHLSLKSHEIFLELDYMVWWCVCVCICVYPVFMCVCISLCVYPVFICVRVRTSLCVPCVYVCVHTEY